MATQSNSIETGGAKKQIYYIDTTTAPETPSGVLR